MCTRGISCPGAGIVVEDEELKEIQRKIKKLLAGDIYKKVFREELQLIDSLD